jgi:DNA polymerase-3 subunit gamma/tau
LREQYNTGADPAVVLADLAEFTHFVTRVKVVPALAEDLALAEVERKRGHAFAEKLSMRVLARAWQMLLKGVTELNSVEDLKNAPPPLAAAEMVLVRMAYAADLPTPDEAIRALDGAAAPARAERNVSSAAQPGAGGTLARHAEARPAEAPLQDLRNDSPRGAPRAALAPDRRPAGDPAERPAAAPALVIGRFEELIALAAQNRDLAVKAALERDVRLVRCEDGRLDIALEPNANRMLANDLARKFSQWTNRRWMVVVSAEPGQPTVRAQREAQASELKSGVRADPLVQAVLARFPGAEIVDVRRGDALAAPTDAADPATAEPPLPDDEASYGAEWQAEAQDDTF